MSLIKSASTALFGIGSYAIYQILLLSLISKFYGTELLGAYAFFFSVTATVFFLTNLGFRQLIVTSKQYTDLNQYIRIRSMLSFGALLFIVGIGVAFKSDHLWLCVCIALIRLLESLSEINYAFFQKREEHGFQSKLLFIKSLLSVVTVLLCVYFDISFVYLLPCILLIHITILLCYEYPKLAVKGERISVSQLVSFVSSDIKLLYFAFPLGLGLFFINLNLNASRIFSGVYLTDIDTAALAASLQLALAGAPLITGICQAFLPRLSKLIREHNFIKTKALYIKLLYLLASISVSGVVIVYFLAEGLLLLFFNHEIAQYALIFSFCVLAAALNYVSAISNLVLTALEAHTLQKNIMLGCVSINILIMFSFVNTLGLQVLVAAFVIASLLRLIISTGYAFYMLSIQSNH